MGKVKEKVSKMFRGRSNVYKKKLWNLGEIKGRYNCVKTVEEEILIVEWLDYPRNVKSRRFQRKTMDGSILSYITKFNRRMTVYCH